MIKGHVCIDLHNHNSGFTERIEKDNMVTNAIKYLLNWSLFRSNLYSISTSSEDKLSTYDYVTNPTPLGSQSMGGIVFFDGKLTEDANNVNFPSNIHITGHAGTGVSTATKLKGSLNVSESSVFSKAESITHIWDFATQQANGKIRSLSLIPVAVGNNIMSTIGHIYSGIQLSPGNTFIIKVDNNYVYYLEYSNVTETSMVLSCYKQKIYLPFGRGIGINEQLFGISVVPIRGSSNTYRDYFSFHKDSREQLWSQTLTVTTSGVSNRWIPTFGRNYSPYLICDKYIYINVCNMQTYYSPNIIIIDRDTILSSTPTIRIATIGNQDSNFAMFPYDNEGTAIFTDNKSGYKYKVNADGTSSSNSSGNIQTPKFYLTSNSTLLPWGDVCCDMGFYHTNYDSSNKSNVISYPDGIEVQTDSSGEILGCPSATLTHNNLCFNDSCYFQGCMLYINSHMLCTICNLDETITKTESTSMKITYTLSNA